MAERARMVDDIMRVASGAFGTAVGLRDEVEAQMRQRIERLVSRTELVGRDEFEAVKALAERALAENERLTDRMAALEKKAAAPARKSGASAKSTASGAKPAASKAAASKSAASKPTGAKSPRRRKTAAKAGGRTGASKSA